MSGGSPPAFALDTSSSPATSQSTAQHKDLSGLEEELRRPLQAVLIHTADLLQRFQQADSAETLLELTPDVEKIATAGEQLQTLIDTVFASHLNQAGQLNNSAFSATIRHDLRTPVNAIIGYSEMLLEDVDEGLDEPLVSAALQDTLNAGRRILSLINELIYYAQGDAQPPPPPAPSAENITPTPSSSPDALWDKVTPALDINIPLTSTESIEDNSVSGSLLLVDDRESNRDLLSRQLSRYGFSVAQAEGGPQALLMLKEQDYDLILLDIIMPGMNGYEVLAHLKSNPHLRHIPVLMISALDEIDSVVRCIEMGAQDYLQKPFNPIILKAKITATLERKRLRDRERAYLKQLQQEQEKSEKLLLNILPQPIAERLKRGERTIVDSFEDSTVLFADLVHFTEYSTSVDPQELINRLNDIFLAFDILAELHGLEKIKTIGDAYMLVGGLPTPRADHAIQVAEMSLDMLDAIDRLNKQNNTHFQLRIGIHSGSVIAGVIGKHKFNYDLWGDTVNIASRMESHGIPGKIQLSETTQHLLSEQFILEERGMTAIKGKGDMMTYFLLCKV